MKKIIPEKQKFVTEGYSLTITPKNIALTEAMQNYIFDKLKKIDRFANNVLDISVILDHQKITYAVTIVLKYYHFQIRVQGNTVDLYSAIDLSFDKLFKLIRKYKTKLQEHHKKEGVDIDMNVKVLSSFEDEVEEINEEIDEENLKKQEELYKFHKVVASEKMSLKSLTQDEAVMKLELSGEPLLIYRGEEDQKLKVIYKRKDEELGLVEVE